MAEDVLAGGRKQESWKVDTSGDLHVALADVGGGTRRGREWKVSTPCTVGVTACLRRRQRAEVYRAILMKHLWRRRAPSHQSIIHSIRFPRGPFSLPTTWT